jgi:phosphatidate cytidylyltransferase
MIFAWYFSRFLTHYTWMVCPVNDFELFPSKLKCMDDGSIHHIFQKAQSIFPTQIFDIFPNYIVKMIPGIVEICNVKGDGIDPKELILTRCTNISAGESTNQQQQVFHHFELIWNNVYPIQIHALWLGLFASVVGPFGGFLASAIKRAYGIKDFDSIIPGHGGITDRLDCQFLMALCTWVHYNSFCKLTTISVPKLIYHYNMMTIIEKKQFLEAIVPLSGVVTSNSDIGIEAGKELLKQFQDYALS